MAEKRAAKLAGKCAQNWKKLARMVKPPNSGRLTLRLPRMTNQWKESTTAM